MEGGETCTIHLLHEIYSLVSFGGNTLHGATNYKEGNVIRMMPLENGNCVGAVDSATPGVINGGKLDDSFNLGLQLLGGHDGVEFRPYGMCLAESPTPALTADRLAGKTYYAYQDGFCWRFQMGVDIWHVLPEACGCTASTCGSCAYSTCGALDAAHNSGSYESTLSDGKQLMQPNCTAPSDQITTTGGK